MSSTTGPEVPDGRRGLLDFVVDAPDEGRQAHNCRDALADRPEAPAQISGPEPAFWGSAQIE